MHYIKKHLVVIASVILAGCGSANVDDLREFTKNAHKGKKPRVEPLPLFRPHTGFAYSASNLTDPFSPTNLRPVRAPLGASHSDKSPDPHRRKEPLESYPLDSLAMVGTLGRANQTWVIIRAPDGSVHHAHMGNYIGENYGRIIELSDSRIKIMELVLDQSGRWVERETGLAVID